MKFSLETSEERRRFLEFFFVILVSLLILGISRFESELFSLSETLSENREFFTTIAYFALININVILILVLSFLILRNVAKLVIERKRGVIGSKLRTKLVVSLVFFALAPTLILFYVSAQFVNSSFEKWFSEKVNVTMQQTREAGALIYEQNEKRIRKLATFAASKVEIVNVEQFLASDQMRLSPKKLNGFAKEYGLSSVQVFDQNGIRIWDSSRGFGNSVPEQLDFFLLESFERLKQPDRPYEISAVLTVGDKDVVKGIVPIVNSLNNELLGAVLIEEGFQTQILKSVERILEDFSKLRPGAQLVRISYIILMVLMTLLITFFATWMGFYVARGIIGPIQSLAEATREVALGNYSIALNAKTDDETGQLVRAFNMMTKDLQAHQQNIEEAQNRLKRSNWELDQRRQYMEIVLKNISGGVLSVNNIGLVTSLNSAGEKLLGLNANQINNLLVSNALGKHYDTFWIPIIEGLQHREFFHGVIDLGQGGHDLSLMVDASRIRDEEQNEMGYVVVFDDAQEQARNQKVAAWREVARRIAHEIKNPITPIKLNAQRLLRKFNGKFDDEEAVIFETCIHTIIQQVDSLRDLVNEFSKFSRLPEVNLKCENLNHIINEVVHFFSMSYSHIEFDTKECESVEEIYLDREQISRAFMNIVTNAIAALVEVRQGIIGFRCKKTLDQKYVQIEIYDNGTGIPSELRKRVLEPYYSTKDEGTGLGLAIVNQTITDHGGDLRIESNESAGTNVVITLPLKIVQ